MSDPHWDLYKDMLPVSYDLYISLKEKYMTGIHSRNMLKLLT